MAHKILVVDDELSIVKLISVNLQREGFAVLTASDGRTALELIRREKPDLILLDIMIPGPDGLEICRTLDREGIRIPIILVTAKDSEVDTVVGLEIGADDYITKPFSTRELVARVRAVLRRSDRNADAASPVVLEYGGLKIYPAGYEAYQNGKVLSLTTKEFELLAYFMKNRGRVISREQLLDALWGYTYVGDSRVVDVHVSHLREKIEPDPKNPRFIKTIRGVGYKFEVKTDENP
ncbi:MAG: response regulator transcription factor [Bacillota bacterium]